MADRWTGFKSSGQVGQPAHGDTGNDDWAEFGGFESASPSSNPFGQPSAPQGFPWATVFPSNTQQNMAAGSAPAFPNQPTVFPTTADQTLTDSPGVFPSLSTQVPQNQVFPISNEQSTLAGSAVAFSTQPPMFPSVRNTDTQPRAQSQHLPTPANELFISPVTEVTSQSSPGELPLTNIPQAPSPQSSSPSLFPVSHSTKNETIFPRVEDVGKLTELQEQLAKSNMKVADHENKLQESEKKLSLAEREKLRLEESLEAMKKKCSDMEDLTKEQNLDVEKQKEKYEELQEKQKEQLKGLREAGQESFAMIVEEYKELSRTAVTQQQEISENQLKQLLEEERDKFTVFVNQQNENIKLLMNEEQEKSSKELKDALEEQKAKHQAELNDCLNEERLRGQEAVAKAVEEERERAKDFVEESLSNQKKEFDVFIEEQKKTFQEMLGEERKQTVKQIEKTVKNEEERAKNAIEEALAEERQSSRDAVAAAKEKTKEEIMKYANEKQKADDAVRLRNYQSMELFLQGVQTQLNTLMNNDDNQTST